LGVDASEIRLRFTQNGNDAVVTYDVIGDYSSEFQSTSFVNDFTAGLSQIHDLNRIMNLGGIHFSTIFLVVFQNRYLVENGAHAGKRFWVVSWQSKLLHQKC
jgi:hypothetical protein